MGHYNLRKACGNVYVIENITPSNRLYNKDEPTVRCEIYPVGPSSGANVSKGSITYKYMYTVPVVRHISPLNLEFFFFKWNNSL